MKNKTGRKIASWMLVFGLAFSFNTGAFAAAKSNNEVERYNRIEKLFDAKDKLLLEKKVDAKKIEKIEKDLQNLGVEKLSTNDVLKKFSKKKSKTGESIITPNVAVPPSTNVTWSSYRTTYSYNGKSYEVQRLIADANTKDSNLKNNGSRAISTSYKWQAGVMNLIKVTASEIGGNIPVLGTAMTFYDAVVGTISSIGRTTEIDGGDCVYSWSSVTRAVFSYVKPVGKSDDYQTMSYISTKSTVATGYQIPTFTYKTTSGSTTVSPKIVQGSKTFTITPSGYDNTYNAVYAFVNYPYAQTRATVDSFSLTGLDNKSVSTVYVVSPAFPAHIR